MLKNKIKVKIQIALNNFLTPNLGYKALLQIQIDNYQVLLAKKKELVTGSLKNSLINYKRLILHLIKKFPQFLITDYLLDFLLLLTRIIRYRFIPVELTIRNRIITIIWMKREIANCLLKAPILCLIIINYKI